jgi:hypothetical protein
LGILAEANGGEVVRDANKLAEAIVHLVFDKFDELLLFQRFWVRNEISPRDARAGWPVAHRLERRSPIHCYKKPQR